MKRTIIIGIGITMLLVFIGIGRFWYLTTLPLYRPGMVSRQKNRSAPLEPPAQPDGTDPWLVEPGIELVHFTVGSGRNVLVIHGGPGIPFSQPLSGLNPLTDGYRFHYYDQRGCGESTRPFDRFDSQNTYENMKTLEGSLGIGAQVADIERIRRILGDKQILLIGHSWGGFLASLYAAEFPDNIAALILVSPANTLVMPQLEEDSDLFASVRANLIGGEQEAFDTFMKEYMDFRSLFDKSETDLVSLNWEFGTFYARAMGKIAVFPKQGRPGGWMVWAQYLSLGQRHDFRPALNTVNVPVLVIHGSEDLQSEKASRMYVEAFPNGKFRLIEDAGHFSFEEQPETFARLIQDFLFAIR